MNADISQKSIVSPLEAARSGRLPHAVVICGADAPARLGAAREAAGALVCEGKSPPCGGCSACRRVSEGTHPDVLEYSGKDKSRSFGVDTVREVRSGAYIIPNEAQCKVYILVRCETMSPGAQNALLKVLEEPPTGVYFFLLCSMPNALLATVLSRSRVFSLGELEASGDADRLGSARRAAEELALATLSPRQSDMLRASAVFEKDRELLRLALPELRDIFRDAVVLRRGGKPVSAAPQTAGRLAQAHGEDKLMRLAERTRLLGVSAESEANLNLLVTLVCSRLK